MFILLQMLKGNLIWDRYYENQSNTIPQERSVTKAKCIVVSSWQIIEKIHEASNVFLNYISRTQENNSREKHKRSLFCFFPTLPSIPLEFKKAQFKLGNNPMGGFFSISPLDHKMNFILWPRRGHLSLSLWIHLESLQHLDDDQLFLLLLLLLLVTMSPEWTNPEPR